MIEAISMFTAIEASSIAKIIFVPLICELKQIIHDKLFDLTYPYY